MLLFTILITLFTGTAPVHDYHVSKTNVRYVAEKSEVQIEMHVFVEDLEKDLIAAGAPTLELGTKRQHQEADRYLETYLRQHFRVKWNGEYLPLETIGYELADDLHGFWIYQVAVVESAPETIHFYNSMITATYADQKNILKFYNGRERSATLLMSKDRAEAEWSSL
ncbi:DUF6702 family protein [Neolewinella agarilytica]|uniref:Uncharacterized protein n=1 Tax=Neolewinella agarilytica TaxID=478744 RepID=A0A1H9AMJ8_9BACT|nr:DUF6702 family protein [Neolewinella agarilytica]SEP78042.1 hypothetical protein SAMN05444359_102159 [Neolewinella agarilytica]